MHVGGWGHKYYSSRSTDLGIKVRIKIKENFLKKIDHLIRAVRMYYVVSFYIQMKNILYTRPKVHERMKYLVVADVQK